MTPTLELHASPALLESGNRGYRLNRASAEVFVRALDESFSPFGVKEPAREEKLKELIEIFAEEIPAMTPLKCPKGEINVMFNAYYGFSIFAVKGSSKFREKVRAANASLLTSGWQGR